MVWKTSFIIQGYDVDDGTIWNSPGFRGCIHTHTVFPNTFVIVKHWHFHCKFQCLFPIVLLVFFLSPDCVECAIRIKVRVTLYHVQNNNCAKNMYPTCSGSFKEIFRDPLIRWTLFSTANCFYCIGLILKGLSKHNLAHFNSTSAETEQ